MPHCGDKNGIGILRVDHDPGYPTGLLQTHVLPGLSGVGGFVDAVTDGDVAADEGLTGSGPDEVWVVGANCESSDRLSRLAVENGSPVDAGIGGFPDPA